MTNLSSDLANAEFFKEVRRHAYDPHSDYFKSQRDWDLMNSQADKVEFLFSFADDPQCHHAEIFYNCVSYFFDLHVMINVKYVDLNDYMFFVLRPGVRWEELLPPGEPTEAALAPRQEDHKALDEFFMASKEERFRLYKEKRSELISSYQNDFKVAHKLLLKMSESDQPNIKWLFNKIQEEFKKTRS